ncbi:MAG TPA: FAD-dependent oxidoreductase [Dongiaceae bacterium]|nr:FAD-dependent oxidoreductase [Dongiaceae bacterium]
MGAKQNIENECVVVGGGMVGMSLALGLAQAGVETLLLDAEPPRASDASDTRASAISYGSRLLLERIGVWRRIEKHACPIRNISVSDGSWRRPFFTASVHYDYRQVRKQGDWKEPFGHIVENRHIRAALAAMVADQPGLRLRAPARLVALAARPNRIEADLADGSQVVSMLLIGADGRNSAVRRLAGIAARDVDYRQVALACTIAHEKPHRDIAHERFLPAGPIAVLPMTDENGIHRSSIVWVERPDLVPLLLSRDADQLGQEIMRRFGERLGRIRVLGSVGAYPLRLTLAARYYALRLMLVGDAAHAIHPVAGQGYNLGIRDVAILLDTLVRARELGLDLGGALLGEDYEKTRLADSLLLAGITDGLTRLFSNDIAPLRLARDLGFFVFDRLPALKRLAMRHAMGLSSHGEG